jgi:energy-coupling factor transport system permease protein
MNLRGFGTNKTRTWYNGKKYEKLDFIALILLFIGTIVGIIVSRFYLTGFWYPF